MSNSGKARNLVLAEVDYDFYTENGQETFIMMAEEMLDRGFGAGRVKILLVCLLDAMKADFAAKVKDEHEVIS